MLAISAAFGRFQLDLRRGIAFVCDSEVVPRERGHGRVAAQIVIRKEIGDHRFGGNLYGDRRVVGGGTSVVVGHLDVHRVGLSAGGGRVRDGGCRRSGQLVGGDGGGGDGQVAAPFVFVVRSGRGGQGCGEIHSSDIGADGRVAEGHDGIRVHRQVHGHDAVAVQCRCEGLHDGLGGCVGVAVPFELSAHGGVLGLVDFRVQRQVQPHDAVAAHRITFWNDMGRELGRYGGVCHPVPGEATADRGGRVAVGGLQRVHVEYDDAVAALDGLHLQGKVTLGGIDGIDGHACDGVRHGHFGCCRGKVQIRTVHGIGDDCRNLFEARCHRVGVAGGRVDGEFEVRSDFELMSVDGLGIGKLVVAIGVHILIGDAVVLAVVFPAVGSYVVHPSVVLRVGTVADLVFMQFLHNEVAYGDAVAAVAAGQGVNDFIDTGFLNDERLVGKVVGLLANVESNVASVAAQISHKGGVPKIIVISP